MKSIYLFLSVIFAIISCTEPTPEVPKSSAVDNYYSTEVVVTNGQCSITP